MNINRSISTLASPYLVIATAPAWGEEAPSAQEPAEGVGQDSDPDGTFRAGAFTLRPMVELRFRGEVRRLVFSSILGVAAGLKNTG